MPIITCCDVISISILLTAIIVMSVRWKKNNVCKDPPLNIWMLVQNTTTLIFTLLRLADNALAAGMRLDSDPQQRYARFCGRIATISLLALLIYPLFWALAVTGTVWFATATDCFADEFFKWGFLIWLLAHYCLLVLMTWVAMLKWLTRRRAHRLGAQQGIAMSEFGVLVDIIRVPDRVFEAARQE